MKKKFKELTSEELEYLRHIYYDEHITHREKMDILTKKFGGVSERSIRRWWREEMNLTESFGNLPKQLQKAREKQIDKDVEILLVTAAQNKTGVHKEFLENLEAYKDYLTNKRGKKTAIVIAPSRYRNPSSPAETNTSRDSDWWVDEVEEYLHYGKIQFGDTLISSESRVRPTAKEPLTGYEVLAKDNHLIIPHSTIQFKTLPRFKNNPLRIMSSTGFITRKNFSDSKAGDIGFENFSFGCVIIEKKKDGTCYIPRNIKVTADGDFIDINIKVEKGKVSVIDSSDGIVLGDIHTRVVDRNILDKTLSLCSRISPEKIVLHDVLDGGSFNPHEVKDTFIQRQKIIRNEHLVEEEVNEALNLIEYIQKKTNAEVNIVISNHDVFLDRYIENNWKNDLHNSPAYLKYALIQQTTDLTKYGGIFGYLVNEKFKENNKVNYINYGESLNISGYECGVHGDFGVNGAKASHKSFSKLNTKVIYGHSHSPMSYLGVTVVGVTSKLNQYYNRRGLSSWAHAHSVIHSNGKNQLLVFGDDNQISGLIKL